MPVSDYNEDPDLNGLVLGIDIGEDCPTNNINDGMRKILADIASWVKGAIFTSPNSGSTGGVRIRDAAGDPDAAYLQFINNAANSQLGYVRGLKAGGLTFGTNAVEAARILSDGKVGIGTTTPAYPLQVNGEVRATTFSLPATNATLGGDNNRTTLGVDTGDYYSYNRVSNLHEFGIGDVRQAYIDGAGRVVASSEVVATTLVRVGGFNNFYLNYNGGAATVNFSANDYLYYDPTFDFWSFSIGNASQAAIGINGTTIGGPSGGQKGNGTLNAQALYDNGNRVLTSASGSAITAQSLASPGYVRFANGLTWQWGETGSVGGEGPQAVSFPIAFTSACFSVTATAKNSGGAANDIWTQVSGVSTSGFNVYWQAPSSGNTGGGAYWFAVGV